MMKKGNINGNKAQEIWKYLKVNSSLRSGDQVKDINWNFAKFLVNKDGTFIKHFDSRKEPEKIRPDIERLLEE